MARGALGCLKSYASKASTGSLQAIAGHGLVARVQKIQDTLRKAELHGDKALLDDANDALAVLSQTVVSNVAALISMEGGGEAIAQVHCPPMQLCVSSHSRQP